MVLQRYRAKAELGKGSFGTVYLTEGRRDRKTYVVKVVDNLRENNLKVQEIRVMMHLKHRNIVEMCDFYTSNNQLCIVMDYADGGDLRREIVKARNAKVPISEEMVTLWMMQVCQALDYAHEEQIIHRDIKPSNIFLMADGRSVKVGDFGISKVLDTAVGKDQMAAPDVEGRVGTKRYMAPEVLNRQEYSNKADIWSLGCVLFELTTLNHPTYEQERKIYFEWIPAVYSRNIQDIIRGCLSEQASVRPSPRELLVKLTAPLMRNQSVQQEFINSLTWFDQQLANKHKQYEAQAAIVRQFVPSHRISPPPQLAPKDANVPHSHVQTLRAATPPPQQPQQEQGKSQSLAKQAYQQQTNSQPQIAPPPQQSTQTPNQQANPPPQPDVPRQAPPGGWADPSAENFPGTGVVLAIDAQGIMSVAGLVQGSAAEQSRMLDVGDIVQEVDTHNVFKRFAGLPTELLSGQVGATVRVGLQKTKDPRRLTYIVLKRTVTPETQNSQQQVYASTNTQNAQNQQPHLYGSRNARSTEIQQQQMYVTSPLPHSSTPKTLEKKKAVSPQAPPRTAGAGESDLEHFNIPEYTDEQEQAMNLNHSHAEERAGDTATPPDGVMQSMHSNAALRNAAFQQAHTPGQQRAIQHAQADVDSHPRHSSSASSQQAESAAQNTQADVALQQAHEAAHNLQRQRIQEQNRLEQQRLVDKERQLLEAQRLEQRQLEAQRAEQMQQESLKNEQRQQEAQRSEQKQQEALRNEQRQNEAQRFEHMRQQEAQQRLQDQQRQLQAQQQQHQAQQQQHQNNFPSSPHQSSFLSSSQQQQQNSFPASPAKHNANAAPPMHTPYEGAHPQQANNYGYQHSGRHANSAYGYMDPYQQHPHSLSSSFDSRSSSVPNGQYAHYDPLGRSFDELGKHMMPSSPHRINTRSSYGADAYQRNAFSYANDQNILMAQQIQVRSGGMPSLRSSHDGRVDNSVPSLRGSFDSASLRATAPAVPMAGNAMGNLGGAPMTAGGTPTRGNVDGDTNRVLAELERVRTGIQATLAAAAAQGKMGPTTPRHPQTPTAGPPPSSYLQGMPNGVPVLPIHSTSGDDTYKDSREALLDGSRYNFAEL